jgi:hypothetical protein
LLLLLPLLLLFGVVYLLPYCWRTQQQTCCCQGYCSAQHAAA